MGKNLMLIILLLIYSLFSYKIGDDEVKNCYKIKMLNESLSVTFNKSDYSVLFIEGNIVENLSSPIQIKKEAFIFGNRFILFVLLNRFIVI
jgi:hypothetical protein